MTGASSIELQFHEKNETIVPGLGGGVDSAEREGGGGGGGGGVGEGGGGGEMMRKGASVASVVVFGIDQT